MVGEVGIKSSSLWFVFAQVTPKSGKIVLACYNKLQA